LSITSVNYDNLTITLIADFDAPIEQVWELWSDPRKLERWWGPPTSLEFTDAFADTDGTPIADMPVSRVRVRLTERDGGTRMEMHSTFESREEMEKLVSMGVVEGLQQAVGQMDALLG
jgi:uncharacterized protein YndB with AHSA1/START domain